jgi:CheY-like chemotaxis protein
MTRKRILFVDDDEQILALVSDFFGDDELDLVTAKDGAEALRILEGDAPIDLLVTDIVMPGGIDGFDIAHRAKQLRPDLHVIYISGFIKNIPWGEKGIGYGPLISKPFRLDDLGREMEKALGPNG